jgi:pimeloyl-ACP methyl ester carboxylesterase
VAIIPAMRTQGQSIRESRFVSIGGIEQWITISGDDKSKPVILFLHGGPGSTMSQYGNVMFKGWEKDFTLVNWDQRGAGKTYGRVAPDELNEEFLAAHPLSVDQMADDGIGLTRYLLKYLNKWKVLLVGSSWCSILGVKMALKSPELFYAYVGHAQFVSQSRSIAYAYQKSFDMAQNAGDTSAVKSLTSFGEPPYDKARTYGQLLRIVKKYERMNAQPAPESWFQIVPEYDNAKDEQHRNDGDDYSFVNFVGDKNFGLRSMVADIDFEETGTTFRLPVFIIQGERDILTPPHLSKSYFDKLTAPRKQYFLLPDAAHGFNQSVVSTLYGVLKNQVSY